MDNDNKPFDTVSIVLLVMIAAISDAADAVSLLVFAVPVIGQVVYLANAFLVSPVVWATIQLWFIMKLKSFGAPGLINLAGGIANTMGIPATTATVVIAIVVANHPKALAAAQLATAAGAGLKAAQAAEKGTKLKAFREEFKAARHEGMLPQRQGLTESQTAAQARHNRELRGEPEPEEVAATYI